VGVFEYLVEILRSTRLTDGARRTNARDWALSGAVVRAIARLDPAAVREDEVRFLAGLLVSRAGQVEVPRYADRQVAADCVSTLAKIAGSRAFSLPLRSYALGSVEQVLASEYGPELRLLADATPLDSDALQDLGERGAALFLWWQTVGTRSGALVLFSDDDAELLDLLLFAARRDRLRAIAETGTLEAYRRILEFRPEVVVTDMNKHYLNGIVLARWIRSKPELASTSIVLLSAEDPHPPPGLFDLEFRKPFDQRRLFRDIRGLLAPRYPVAQ
jgi:CheY-like chemotaxis protein